MFIAAPRVDPPVLTLKQGVDAHITCFSFSTPKWTYSDSYLPSNHHISNAGRKLTIKSISSNNIGNYYCRGTQKNGKPFIARGNLKILREFFFYFSFPNIFSTYIYILLNKLINKFKDAVLIITINHKSTFFSFEMTCNKPASLVINNATNLLIG